MKRWITMAAALVVLLALACPAAAAGVLGPMDLIDTLYSSDSERYMKSHYIAADTMYTLTDVQIASILYEAIEPHRADAARIWNFINGDFEDYTQMTVVELLLGEFINLDGTQKAWEFEQKGILEFIEVLDNAVAIALPDADYKIIHVGLNEITYNIGRGQNETQALIAIYKEIGEIDKKFWDKTKDLFAKADFVSSVFTGIEIASQSITDMNNLYRAAGVFRGLEEEYKQIFSRLRSNALSAGRNELAKEIDVVMNLAMHEGKWDATKLSLTAKTLILDAFEFFFETMLTKLSIKWTLNITASVMAQRFAAADVFIYKAGTFVLNWAFDVDKVAQIYVRMEALAQLEQAGAQTLVQTKNDLLNNPTYDNARLFHTAMRLQQQIEIDACELFIELCRLFNENGFKQMFGSVDYGEFIAEYEDMRDSLAAKKCCGILEDRAEENCKENLTYTKYADVNEWKIRITGCKNKSFASIRIPETIDGYPVTGITENAFQNHIRLQQIELPKTVQKIYSNAFKGCTQLERVNIPADVDYIGYGAFSNCIRLTDIHIPEKVTSIEKETFYMCTGLESVELSDAIYKIDANAFYGCANLTNIDLPESLRSMGDYAFSKSGLVSVDIPKQVSVIAWYAFSECSSLKSVIMYADTHTIGRGAFYLCKNLASVTLPYTIREIDDFAFSCCEALNKITLGNRLTRIGASAFIQCKSLQEVSIPYSVKTIEDTAFADCINLKRATFVSGVQKLGYGVFKGCSGLLIAEIPDTVTEIGNDLFLFCSSLQRVSLSENITKIPDDAFCLCESLTECVIPSSVKSIGTYAFSGCTSLSEIHLPEKLEYIGLAAFENCQSLQSIDIPDTVVTLGERAFEMCQQLRTAKLPECITSIPYRLFASCTSLESIEIPYSVREIGDTAFYQCMSLREMVLPDEIESIGAYAFAKCSGIDRFVLPSSLKTLGEAAFYDCTNLKDIVLPYGLTSMGDWVFEACASIENISIPQTLQEIPAYAFLNCTNLKYAYFHGDIGFIGEDAFRIGDDDPSKTSLEYIYAPINSYASEYFEMTHPSVYVISKEYPELHLPAHMKEIQEESFAGSGLTTVSLPDGAKSIGYRAFADCKTLRQITIPASVTTIALTAFQGCTDRLVIFTPAGSAAAQYAKAHDIICIPQ